jgi:hypothetical protein
MALLPPLTGRADCSDRLYGAIGDGFRWIADRVQWFTYWDAVLTLGTLATMA